MDPVIVELRPPSQPPHVLPDNQLLREQDTCLLEWHFFYAFQTIQ